MKETTVDTPHGTFFDRDGRPCLRFANWDTEQKHSVPDYVDVRRGPDAVDGPGAHTHEIDAKYRPEVDR